MFCAIAIAYKPLLVLILSGEFPGLPDFENSRSQVCRRMVKLLRELRSGFSLFI